MGIYYLKIEIKFPRKVKFFIKDSEYPLSKLGIFNIKD